VHVKSVGIADFVNLPLLHNVILNSDSSTNESRELKIESFYIHLSTKLECAVYIFSRYKAIMIMKTGSIKSKVPIS